MIWSAGVCDRSTCENGDLGARLLLGTEGKTSLRPFFSGLESLGLPTGSHPSASTVQKGTLCANLKLLI